MCGIGGILSYDGDVVREQLTSIVVALRHRGPDGNGIFEEGGIGLCHTRLAILDLSDLATQPMQSKNGRYVISYNGEIFNFQTLRAKLSDAGQFVASSGDTEVLLEYIAFYGIRETLQQLEGQFAFAVWDRRERELHLARDRHGIKPLYYGTCRGKIYFASETKALLDIVDVDPGSVDAMLLGLACTWDDRTPFRNVKTVRPGEVVTINSTGATRCERFFQMSELVDEGLYNELDGMPTQSVLDLVEATLAASMDMQIVSDAPLACLLSGGLDSTLISAYAFDRVNDVSFFHADVKGNSEFPAAKFAAGKLDGALFTTTVGDKEFAECIPEVVFANDLPVIYHPNSMPFYLVCKLAHQHGIKVLLTGEGSDELFIGYPKTIIDPFLQRVNSLKQMIRGAIAKTMPKFLHLFWPDTKKSMANFLQRMVFLYENERIDADCQNAVRHIKDSKERKLQAASLKLIESHLSSILHRNDRMGMAWSLESRFPLLDMGVTKFAINLPSRYKLRRTLRFYDSRHPFLVDKWCIRKLCEKRMPYELAYRKKRGFPTSTTDRMSLRESFFQDGFCSDWYRIPRNVMNMILSSNDRSCINNLMMLEIWGQLFVQRRSLQSVTQSYTANLIINPN